MKIQNSKFKIQNSKGFTLIELIVVMAVFLLIIGAAIGIFISIVQNQRRILSEQELLNQVSYVEEYMSKALRMATKDLDGNCAGAGYHYLLTRPKGDVYTGIKFLNQSNTDPLSGEPICQEFYLDTEIGILKELKNSDNDNYAVPLTSEKIKVNSIRFGINGASGNAGGTFYASEEDNIQPRVTISLDVQVRNDAQALSKKIQTTVSQRNLNIK